MSIPKVSYCLDRFVISGCIGWRSLSHRAWSLAGGYHYSSTSIRWTLATNSSLG